jgi:hypothetical protein
VSTASATFTFTAAPGTQAQCALDGAAFADCTSPATYTSLADGSHTFTLRARDDATPPNVSATVSRTWTVATAAPTVTITSKPPALTNARTATFAFTGPAQTTFECRLDGAAFAACTSPKAYSGLANGSHTFGLRGRAPSGALSPVVAYTWTVDTVAPVVTITARPPSTTTSRAATFAFTANDPQATFQCRIDTGAYAACTSPKTYSGVAPGRHTFQVRATDPAGNVSSAASRSWRIR